MLLREQNAYLVARLCALEARLKAAEAAAEAAGGGGGGGGGGTWGAAGLGVALSTEARVLQRREAALKQRLKQLEARCPSGGSGHEPRQNAHSYLRK